MKFVFLLIAEDKTILAVYDDETLATTMKPALEQKFGLTLVLEKRSVNQDIKMIGVVK